MSPCTSVRSGNQQHFRQREKGFALTSTVLCASLGTLSLLLFANAVLPTYQYAGSYALRTSNRSHAESGLDWAIAQLTAAKEAGTISPLDDLTTDGSPKVTTIPTNVLGTGIQATISVNNLKPPEDSFLYDAQFDPLKTGAVVSTNEWRVVQVSSSYAGLTHSIRTILKPMYNPPSGATPYFSMLLLGVDDIKVNGVVTTDGYDSRTLLPVIDLFGGTIGSNKNITLNGAAVIGGSLLVNSLPKGSTAAEVASANIASKVLDQVKVNGVTKGFKSTSGILPGPLDSVMGLGNGVPRGGDRLTPMDVSQSNNAFAVPPNKPAPTAAVDLGALNISGTGRLVVKNGAPVPSSNLHLTNNTVYVPPGDYKVSSISVTGLGSIEIQSSITTPVRFFVSGATPGADAVHLSSVGLVNLPTKPALFQIWYEGSKNIKLNSLPNYYGVIYAPNAKVNISSVGLWTGAMVAKSFEINTASVLHFDKALLDPGYAQQYGLMYQPGSTITGLKAVSWEEL